MVDWLSCQMSYLLEIRIIYNMINKNQKLLRWRLMLQEYNLDIIHIKGKYNIISDTFSRV